MWREEIIIDKWQLDRAPAPLGKHFLVITSWQQDQIADQYRDRQTLIIDPGVAFSPDHATVNLSITLLEKYWKGGRLLDVSTGSSVVAMAASLLAPRAIITAIETDEDVIEHAIHSIAINNLTDKIDIGQYDLANYRGGNYSIVAANLLSSIILGQLPALASCLATEGIMILSGIPVNEIENLKISWGWGETSIDSLDWASIAPAIESAGLTLISSEIRGQWRAIAAKKKKEFNHEEHEVSDPELRALRELRG